MGRAVVTMFRVDDPGPVPGRVSEAVVKFAVAPVGNPLAVSEIAEPYTGCGVTTTW